MTTVTRLGPAGFTRAYSSFDLLADKVGADKAPVPLSVTRLGLVGQSRFNMMPMSGAPVMVTGRVTMHLAEARHSAHYRVTRATMNPAAPRETQNADT